MTTLMDVSASLGINSLHVVGDELYFFNSNQHSFNKVLVDIRTGRSKAPVKTLVNSTSVYPDDFTIDFEGNV